MNPRSAVHATRSTCTLAATASGEPIAADPHAIFHRGRNQPKGTGNGGQNGSTAAPEPGARALRKASPISFGLQPDRTPPPDANAPEETRSSCRRRYGFGGATRAEGQTDALF